MRLVCPNCEAKYEVPEDAIPETGRDVQCANCGHAWYQMRPRAAVAEAAPVAAAVAAPPVAEPEPVPVVEPMPEPEMLPEAAVLADPVPEVAETVGEAVENVAEGALASVADAVEVIETATKDVAGELGTSTDTPVAESDPAPVSDTPPEDAAPVEAAPTDVAADTGVVSETPDTAVAAPLAGAGAAPAAYAVDDSVLAILREEAEREASARRAETAKPLEVQADLGIEAAMPVARKPVDDPVTPPSPVKDEDADDTLSARRTRLPDVEEINSTLRPGEQSDGGADVMPVLAEGRSSFRKGFLLVMTFAILGAALYVSAGALSNAVPALAGFLEAYVGFIDSLRLQLDGLMQSATVAINGV